MTLFVGIDPGCKGGIATINESGGVVSLLKLESSTDHDVANYLRDLPGTVLAVLEKLSPAPPFKPKGPLKVDANGFGRGGTANFKIGDSFGVLRGILTASRITYAIKTPQVWQRSMGCLTGGDKKISYAAAQRLYPDVRVTQWNCDAILLAAYCKREAVNLFPQAVTA